MPHWRGSRVRSTQRPRQLVSFGRQSAARAGCAACALGRPRSRIAIDAACVPSACRSHAAIARVAHKATGHIRGPPTATSADVNRREAEASRRLRPAIRTLRERDPLHTTHQSSEGRHAPVKQLRPESAPPYARCHVRPTPPCGDSRNASTTATGIMWWRGSSGRVGARRPKARSRRTCVETSTVRAHADVTVRRAHIRRRSTEFGDQTASGYFTASRENV